MKPCIRGHDQLTENLHVHPLRRRLHSGTHRGDGDGRGQHPLRAAQCGHRGARAPRARVPGHQSLRLGARPRHARGPDSLRDSRHQPLPRGAPRTDPPRPRGRRSRPGSVPERALQRDRRPGAHPETQFLSAPLRDARRRHRRDGGTGGGRGARAPPGDGGAPARQGTLSPRRALQPRGSHPVPLDGIV